MSAKPSSSSARRMNLRRPLKADCVWKSIQLILIRTVNQRHTYHTHGVKMPTDKSEGL